MARDRNLLECRICGWHWFTRYERLPRKCPNCFSLRWALGPRPPAKWRLRQKLGNGGGS